MSSFLSYASDSMRRLNFSLRHGAASDGSFYSGYHDMQHSSDGTAPSPAGSRHWGGSIRAVSMTSSPGTGTSGGSSMFASAIRSLLKSSGSGLRSTMEKLSILAEPSTGR